jgi:hypothetical protein
MDHKHTNLNLRLDLHNLSVSQEKLGNWKPQNFTSILNKPTTQQFVSHFNLEFYNECKTLLRHPDRSGYRKK